MIDSAELLADLAEEFTYATNGVVDITYATATFEKTSVPVFTTFPEHNGASTFVAAASGAGYWCTACYD